MSIKIRIAALATLAVSGSIASGYRRCGWVRQFDAHGDYLGRVRACNYC